MSFFNHFIVITDPCTGPIELSKAAIVYTEVRTKFRSVLEEEMYRGSRTRSARVAFYVRLIVVFLDRLLVSLCKLVLLRLWFM